MNTPSIRLIANGSTLIQGLGLGAARNWREGDDDGEWRERV